MGLPGARRLPGGWRGGKVTLKPGGVAPAPIASAWFGSEKGSPWASRASKPRQLKDGVFFGGCVMHPLVLLEVRGWFWIGVFSLFFWLIPSPSLMLAVSGEGPR